MPQAASCHRLPHATGVGRAPHGLPRDGGVTAPCGPAGEVAAHAGGTTEIAALLQ